MIQALYESSLVIINRGIISLSTHKKSPKLYDSYNVYLFDNLHTNCTKNLNGVKKERQRNGEMNEKGCSWNQSIHSSLKITNFVTLEK